MLNIFINLKIYILGLVLMSGLASGLIVGYLSIDTLMLELKIISGTDSEKKVAKKVMPILNKRHWLLVSLLILNTACMESLPLFLDKIFVEYIAIIISVTLCLLFGEIIPQALCTGPSQVKIAASLSWLALFIMYITSPISYPLAWLLDVLFGHHANSR